MYSYFGESEIQLGKIFADDICFAKVPSPEFALYGKISHVAITDTTKCAPVYIQVYHRKVLHIKTNTKLRSKSKVFDLAIAATWTA